MNLLINFHLEGLFYVRDCSISLRSSFTLELKDSKTTVIDLKWKFFVGDLSMFSRSNHF